MGLKVTNNAYGTLNASITSSSTTIVLVAGQGARFPTLSAGDYFYATLIDTSNNLEVVKVTARSTDTLTVVRGQDSTTARAYATNDRFELRPTAALFTEVIDTANAALPKAGGVMASGGRIQFQNSDGYTLYGIRGTRYGYSGSYRAIQIGNGTSSENVSLGVDVSAIAGGAFTGNGKDIVVPNGAMFSMPNSGNTDFVVPLQFDTAGRVLNPIQPFVYASYAGAALARGTKIPVTTGQTRGSGWDNSLYRFTAPVAGVYHATLNITGNTSQPSASQPGIYVNGAVIAYSYYPGGTVAISRVLSAGDYIEFYYNHDSAGYSGASTAQASVAFLG